MICDLPKPRTFAGNALDTSLRHLAHVPTPGDHYSPATGSAIMTITYELNREHARRGGGSTVLISRGARFEYPIGERVEIAPGSYPNRWQRGLDSVTAAVGGSRRFGEGVYRPAAEALDRDFRGVLIVWNCAAPVQLLRRAYPKAHLCLYAQNEIFRSYGPGELRRVLGAADTVLCCSEFIAEGIRQRAGDGDGKVFAVVNGVDTQRFVPATRKRVNEVPVVLFVGRVVPEKGTDVLLKAAAKVYSGERRFVIRVVGSRGFSAEEPLSAYEQELRRLAEALPGAAQFQRFVDRHRVLEEYQAADVFCAPSNWDEPCSLTVPEAMACGLPTIASRRGCIPEVAGDGALLFDPSNIDELAEHLAHLTDDESARADWGARARTRAEQISWSAQYDAILEVLERRR